MPARLTVVVPMFNSAATVAEAIRSVQEQSFTDWCLIVVNDGSTDNGAAIVDEIARCDDRVSMVHQENQGLAGARNAGLEAALARGTEFISFLDSDDWMLPGVYEALVAAAAETGASYAGYELCDERGRSLGRQSPISAPIVGLDEQIEWNRTATHAHLFSRAMIGDCRFDARLKVVEDYDMWLRLAVRGEQWKAVERTVAAYRLRPASMSKQFGPMCDCYERVLRKAFEEARLFGWDQKIDLSEARFRRVVGHSAVMYATMEALIEPGPSKPRAAALLHRASRPETFTPAQLAQAASTALLFGACTAPDVDGCRERRWLLALRQWWVRCADERWIGFEDIDPAMNELARKVVHPDAIAASMLHAAKGHGHPREQGLVVVGLDRNSRRLARQAAAKGWRVLALDDFSDPRERDLLEANPAITRVSSTADFGRSVAKGFAGASWITGMAGASAETTVRRVIRDAAASPPRVELWDSHRDRLGAENYGYMLTAVRPAAAKAG